MPRHRIARLVISSRRTTLPEGATKMAIKFACFLALVPRTDQYKV